jgi:hypothetical protein
MTTDYKPTKPMKEVSAQLRKLQRKYLRYQQAELVYSLSHKKLMQLASEAGAIYRFDGMLISAVHEEDGHEGLNLLMVDDRIPAGAKLY